MVQLSSGGPDEGGPGTDGPDTQNELEDDTGAMEPRRLRPDARSDPLDDPTEPEPSPEGTTAKAEGSSSPAQSSDPLGGTEGSAGRTSARPAQGAQRDDGDLGLPGDQRTRVDDLTDDQRRAISEARADVRGRVRDRYDVGPGGVETFLMRDSDGELVVRSRLTEQGAETVAAREASARRAQGNAINVEAVKDTTRLAGPTTSLAGGAIDVEAAESYGEQRARFEATQGSGPTDSVDRKVAEGETLLSSLGVTLPEFNRAVTPGPGAGRAEAAGTTRLELGDFFSGPLSLPTFGERTVTPGPGAGTRPRTGRNEILTGSIYGTPATEDFGDFFGGTPIPIFSERPVTPGPGAGAREQTGTVTLDEAFDIAGENLSSSFETIPVGERPVTPGRGTAPRERVPIGEAPEQNQQLARGLETVGNLLPTAPAALGGLAVDVGDYGVALGSALTPEFGERAVSPGPGSAARQQLEGPDFDRAGDLLGGGIQTGANVGVQFADYTIENPVEVGTAAIGTLGLSAATFGAAAAVGGRTSLAARALIQPGEEAAGLLGYGVTRPVLGASRAGRLFPRAGEFGREPLLFSEEAAIRAGRRAYARGRGLLEGKLPDLDLGRMSRNLETGFSELRTQARIEDTPPGPGLLSYGEPRALVEGPVIASSPRALASGDLGPGEFVIRPRGIGDTELEAGDGDGPLDLDDLSGAGDGGMNIGGGSFDLEIERETDSGVLVERVRTRRPRAAESDLTRDLRADFGGRRRRVEFDLGLGTVEGPTLGIDPFGGSLAAPGELVGDLVGGDLAGPADFEIGRGDLLNELGFEQGAEVELEPRTRLELYGAEQEFELAAELEGRRETRAERFDLRDGPLDTERSGPDYYGSATLIERELLNPITGR